MPWWKMSTQGERATVKSPPPCLWGSTYLLPVQAQVGRLQRGGWASVHMAWFHHQLSAGCRGFLELSRVGFLHPRVLWQASPCLDQACNGSDCTAQEFCSAAGAGVHPLRLPSRSASWLHGLWE